MELKLSKEISHLSSKQIEELYDKYLSGEKNQGLVEQYGIDINPNKLISIFPPVEHKEILCPYCKVSMYSKRKRKSSSSWEAPPLQCFTCNHVVYKPDRYGESRGCRCTPCIEYRLKSEQLAIQNIRENIRLKYNLDGINSYSYSNLGFSHKLFLLALFRMQTDENFEFIQSIDDPIQSTILSPTSHMDTAIIQELYLNKVLLVDPSSHIDAFDKEENYKISDINKVRWVSNITFDGTHRASLDETFKALYKDFLSAIQPSWKDEVFSLLYQIAREEVVQHIKLQSKKLGVDFSAEKKIRIVITELLHRFPASKINYFANIAIKNALALYAGGDFRGKAHAGNTIPNKMLKLGERAYADKWDWQRFKDYRNAKTPQSSISILFHDVLFLENDEGFVKTPKALWEQELFPRYFSVSDCSDSQIACKSCGSLSVNLEMLNNHIIVECLDCGERLEYRSE
jgi:hypothetical protein